MLYLVLRFMRRTSCKKYSYSVCILTLIGKKLDVPHTADNVYGELFMFVYIDMLVVHHKVLRVAELKIINKNVELN